MLAMKAECERCQSELRAMGEAYICSYECTFCAQCQGQLDGVCPNCAGELVRRPHRAPRQAEP